MALGLTQPSVRVYGGFFQGGAINWQRHEADLSPSSSAKIKNQWSYISTFPYASMACTMTLHCNPLQNLAFKWESTVMMCKRNLIVSYSNGIHFCLVSMQMQLNCNKELSLLQTHQLHFHLLITLITGSFETITKPFSTSNQLSSGLRLQTRDHPSLFSAKYV